MNRLQKKCVIASTGFHLLLVVILFVGPAFLSSRDKADDMPVLDFIPMKTIDAAFSGGGNPTAKPPPTEPQPQTPAPQTQVAHPAPQPQPQPVKHVVSSPESSLVPAESKRKLPQVSTKLVTRSQTRTTKSSSSQADADARAAAERREAYSSAVSSLRGDLSSKTTVGDIYGPGGGGPTYANFNQAVKSIYARAWAGTVPQGATEANTFAIAKVTIARDGTVVSSRIVQSSGKPLVDASVQAVLDRIRKAVPIPDDSKDKERTVEIKFEVKPRN